MSENSKTAAVSTPAATSLEAASARIPLIGEPAPALQP